jgi:hypothetical protein
MEQTAGFVIGVRNVVTALHALAGYLANTTHGVPRAFLRVTHSLGDFGLAIACTQ